MQSKQRPHFSREMCPKLQFFPQWSSGLTTKATSARLASSSFLPTGNMTFNRETFILLKIKIIHSSQVSYFEEEVFKILKEERGVNGRVWHRWSDQVNFEIELKSCRSARHSLRANTPLRLCGSQQDVVGCQKTAQSSGTITKWVKARIRFYCLLLFVFSQFLNLHFLE